MKWHCLHMQILMSVTPLTLVVVITSVGTQLVAITAVVQAYTISPLMEKHAKVN